MASRWAIRHCLCTQATADGACASYGPMGVEGLEHPSVASQVAQQAHGTFGALPAAQPCSTLSKRCLSRSPVALMALPACRTALQRFMLCLTAVWPLWPLRALPICCGAVYV